MKKLAIIVLFTLTALQGLAQKNAAAPEKTRVLIILDCSNSMWDKWQSEPKIKITQQVLLHVLDSVHGRPDFEVALRVFGHLNKESFSTRLEVPFEPDNYHKLQSKIKTLVPNGGCAAASALTNSLNDFPHDGKARNIILIITDGMDDCQNSICDVAKQIQQSGTIARTFIIGIGNAADFQKNLDCAGQFSFLSDEEMFDETLLETFYLSDQKALVTITLTDNQHNPYETEVPVVFLDHLSHSVRYATVYHYDTEHTSDTLSVDPFANYDITLYTKPPIRMTNCQFKAGRHNPLEIQAPQGSLLLHFENKRTSFPLPDYHAIVRKHGETEMISHQPFNTKTMFLSGKYDIEILSVPILTLSNVDVRSGSSTDLQIPLPGQLALDKPQGVTCGSVFAYKEGVLKWVCDLNPAIASERIILMPGDYQIILKPQGTSDYTSVRTTRFSIQSGKQTGIKLK